MYYLFRLYKILLSPLFGVCCRFSPTCSEYAYGCYQKHNLSHAVHLIVKRMMRCNPWGGSGYDPVP